MKSLILGTLLGLLLILPWQSRAGNLELSSTGDLTTVSTEVQANSQVSVEPVEKKGFLGRMMDKISDTAIYTVIGLIGGMAAGKGWIAKLKVWLGFGVAVTHSLSELLASTSDGLKVLNDSIQDNGKLKENSLDDILAAKRKLVVDTTDAILTIKPKK